MNIYIIPICYSIQLLRHEKNVSMITNDVKVNHIKARKPKQTKKNIGDIYLQYHHLCNDGSDESIDSNNKAEIPDLGWFLRRNSTNTA